MDLARRFPMTSPDHCQKLRSLMISPNFCGRICGFLRFSVPQAELSRQWKSHLQMDYKRTAVESPSLWKNSLESTRNLWLNQLPFFLIHHQKSHHLVHVLREQVVAHFLIDLRVRPPITRNYMDLWRLQLVLTRLQTNLQAGGALYERYLPISSQLNSYSNLLRCDE